MTEQPTGSEPSRAGSKGTDRALFLGFLVLFPILIYPQFLIEMVLEHRGIYFSNGELVYYVPRLVAMLLLVLLTWRSWTTGGWFPKLLLANGAWISLVTLLHPDPDGLWYTLGGNIDRLDGLAYQLLLVGVGMTAYGLMCRARERGESWHLSVRSTMAVGGLIPAALVLLQGAGVDPVGWLVWGKSLPFASATLGHPGFAACVLLIATLLALSASLERRRRAMWLIVLTIESTALGVTGNRTALIGLLMGLLIGWLVGRGRNWAVFASLALVLSMAGNLAPKWIGSSTVNGEQHLTNANTLATRIQLWRIAGRVLVSSPETLLTGLGSGGLQLAAIEILPADALVPFWRLEKGWGQDTVQSFQYSSNGPQYRDALATAVLRSPDGTVHRQQFYPSVDKAHDFFLDRALAYGILDTLLWAALFLVPLLRALSGPTRAHAVTFAPVVGALLVFGVTWFGSVQTEPLQLIVLAGSWATVAGANRNGSAPPVANGT